MLYVYSRIAEHVQHVWYMCKLGIKSNALMSVHPIRHNNWRSIRHVRDGGPVNTVGYWLDTKICQQKISKQKTLHSHSPVQIIFAMISMYVRMIVYLF